MAFFFNRGPTLISSQAVDPFWTIFTATEPSGEGTGHVGAGTRKIYVSAQSGSDGNTGTLASPKATLSAGIAALRNGSPDWLLLKKGDTWTQEQLDVANKAGPSSSAPMLIGAYGTGARPLLKRTHLDDQGAHTVSGNCSNLYIVGLNMYAHARDPDSPDFIAAPSTSGESNTSSGLQLQGTGTLFVMEDCRVSFYRHNIDIIATYGTVKLRRCVILDAYDVLAPASGNTEGIFFNNCDIPIIEECILDNNGNNIPLGHTAIPLSHGLYFKQTGSIVNPPGIDAGTSICNGNWFSNNAVEGCQLRAGGTMIGNFYYRQGTGFDLGHEPGDPEGGQLQTSVNCRNNVVMRSIDVNAGRRGQGFQIDGLDGTAGNVFIQGNIICHLHPDAFVVGAAFAIEIVSGRGTNDISVINNIIFKWHDDIHNGGTTTTITPNEIDLAGANTHGFSDPNRGINGIGAYYASIGGPNSETAFIAAIRAQSKDTWDSRLTAKAAVNYIRAGFDLSAI